MNANQNETEKSEIIKIAVFSFIAVISLVFIYAGFLIIVTWPLSDLSISKSGTFGDSFGLLNALFSGLAFAGLIVAILLQREELSLQRQELKETRAELKGQKEQFVLQNKTLKLQQFEK